MKPQFVADLRAGDDVLSFFLVREQRLEPFRDPSKGRYLALVLADRSGEIAARMWEGGPEAAEEIAAGTVVKVKGTMEAYRGRRQLIITRIRSAQENEVDPADYMRTSGRDVETMLSEVQEAIGAVREPHLQRLLHSFFGDEAFRAALRQAPATRRSHHATRGGLLEHMVDMLALSRPLLQITPSLNEDLLTTGILLHDVGRLRELRFLGLDIASSDEGRLLGHVVLGDQLISEHIVQFSDFPRSLALQVHHMILSHHGRAEEEATHPPRTLEAAALHHLNELSGQVSRYAEVLDAEPETGHAWTRYDRGLRRSLYVGRETVRPEEDGA
jgi:3'-5' exoribonuclease